MNKEGATKDPGGQQPDMERGLDAAARAGGLKPQEQTNDAIPSTRPGASSLAKEEAVAAEILKRGAERDTGKKA